MGIMQGRRGAGFLLPVGAEQLVVIGIELGRGVVGDIQQAAGIRTGLAPDSSRAPGCGDEGERVAAGEGSGHAKHS